LEGGKGGTTKKTDRRLLKLMIEPRQRTKKKHLLAPVKNFSKVSAKAQGEKRTFKGGSFLSRGW